MIKIGRLHDRIVEMTDLDRVAGAKRALSLLTLASTSGPKKPAADGVRRQTHRELDRRC
ncbi:MAG: hypothetical protein ACT4N7_00085 [Actinokineospora sp.]